MRNILLPNPNVLSQTVIRLGLVSFFADISSEMLYPITPIFLTGVLGASMLSVGIIEGVAEGIASLLKIYSGAWSDRTQKRKPWIVGGYLLAALSKPLIGMSSSWGHVLAARGIDRTGKGLRTAPRDALLAESVPSAYRAEAFGWHRLMDTLGAAIGPLFAISFLSLHPSELRPLYYWAAIPGFVAVGIACLVQESKTVLKLPRQAALRFSWRETSPAFRSYLGAWTIFALGNSSDAFLLLKAKHSGISLVSTILMYCLYNLIYAVFSPYLGKLSDRFGKREMLILGLIAFALIYTGFATSSAPWMYWALFGAYGLFMAATDGAGKALIIDLVPKHLKATGIGIFGTFTGIATIFASVSAGVLWDHVGPSAPFLFGAGGAIISAILLSPIHNPTRTTPNQGRSG